LSLDYDQELARAIVDTVREPLLVLDGELRVLAASRSFYSTFQVSRDETRNRLLETLGGGQWNIPALREALQNILAKQSVMEGFEVECDFPVIGRRVMLLNGRKIFYESDKRSTILLAIEDISERRAIEQQRDGLLRERDLLLQEMQHRVANSLQIIASILLIKARTVNSDETRLHLQDAHQRVLAMAAVQKHLHASLGGEAIELQPYFSLLCKSLADSMIGESRAVAVEVMVDAARASSSEAVSLGLIVTELMINALKHAFPIEAPGQRIGVRYEIGAPGWRLTVSDNGIGKQESTPAKVGLGTSIVAALAEQLHARVEIAEAASGTAIVIAHGDFVVLPSAA
jgi:two-component sensor histidine kinase